MVTRSYAYEMGARQLVKCVYDGNQKLCIIDDSFGIKGFHDLWLGLDDSSEIGKLQDFSAMTIIVKKREVWIMYIYEITQDNCQTLICWIFTRESKSMKLGNLQRG
jgi:hypothetical protein